MAGEYMSVAEFSRRNKYDAQLLNRLIKQYKITPDIKTGKIKLFKPERLHGIVEILDDALRHDTSL